MNARKVAKAVINVSLEIIFAALVIIMLYNSGITAYSFGFDVFADQPVASEPGRDINVSIDGNLSAFEIGKLLEEKGLIKDARLFYVQMKLMTEEQVISGRYTLNTSMTAEDIINTITTTVEEEDEEEE